MTTETESSFADKSQLLSDEESAGSDNLPGQESSGFTSSLETSSLETTDQDTSTPSLECVTEGDHTDCLIPTELVYQSEIIIQPAYNFEPEMAAEVATEVQAEAETGDAVELGVAPAQNPNDAVPAEESGDAENANEASGTVNVLAPEPTSDSQSDLSKESPVESNSDKASCGSAAIEVAPAQNPIDTVPAEESGDTENANEASGTVNVLAPEPTSDSQSDLSKESPAESKSDKASSGSAEIVAAEESEKEPTFQDFELAKPVQLAIEESGYKTPTPVQSQIIPRMLEGRDVLAQSQTGTGKTAAFALPILSQVNTRQRVPQVLVLAPTRELATQVSESFETYGKNIPKLRVLSIYGGTDYEGQLRALRRGVQIVVGTPGRVIDHLKRGSLHLDALQCVVLDEADEMLNMGFQEDVEFILEQTPDEKQMTLFSATMPEAIREIADEHLHDPYRITIRRKQLTAESVEQRCIIVETSNKVELLSRLLEVEETDGVIVFAKTKDATINIAEQLSHKGLRAAALNGDLPQARRERTVDQLKAGKIDVLIATDIAARGLDVQRISHVINFDLPHDGESYVHRIGRTGRAGRTGISYIFLTDKQRGKLRLIERATKKTIKIVDAPTPEQLTSARIDSFKESVLSHVGNGDAELYASVLKELVDQSGESLETIASGLAHMARRGRPLVAQAFRSLKPAPTRERGRRRDGDPRGGREPLRRDKRARPPEKGMQRFWIAVGHSDEVRPGNIVGAVANESGIAGRDIGPIHIHENYSTIDLPKRMAGRVLKTLQNTRVAGKKLSIRVFEERGPRSSKRAASEPNQPFRRRGPRDADASGPRKKKRKDKNRAR